ncbi:MAG: hypothetical protein ACPW60_07565 [Methylohalobius sp. ZOD2]
MKLNPDYTEDAVSLIMASHLSVTHFPKLRFSIEPISRKRERWLGADARLLSKAKGFLPFYMQFKRPFGHSEPSRAKVVQERKKLKPPLETSPTTLYFGLQDKRQEHRDYQHNVLFRLRERLRRRQIGDAAYVCPLFLERQAYVFAAHASGVLNWLRRWPSYPYKVKWILINEPHHLADAFNDIPVFSEHVSIPPHALVSSAKHSYSFTEEGTELCFHSPLSLPEGAEPFARWLGGLANLAVTGEVLVNEENSQGILSDLMSASGDYDGLTPEDQEGGFSGWFAFGAHLRERYSIEQYAFVLHD